jgi:hypothetical protein
MKEPSIEEFRKAAEEFCKLAAAEKPVTIGDLWLIRGLLLRLIFHISAVEAHQHRADFDGLRLDGAELHRSVERFGSFPFNLYRVVFDPHDFDATDEPATGMLADDLSDIYRDLHEGLNGARNHHLNDACFDWAHSYTHHWARHAVNALAAIEIYRTDNELRVDKQ